ncbi:TPA: TfoX/Sxy family DNA transformation protein [Mannheimia haemolytica]|uniref:TfoX/Sxy family DNA transformation protein n=1 Tax=Mannheimia haemolytica TaxID=75985 RepID=UPI0011BB698F|nr:TfoX/Sxy family DNA transformation protein [Mannheimia haemolytica]QEB86304.1 DNA transformation protein [Mannheimia haemolytica]QEB88727.1 DNA transformation protein [Mannheimia haemolytica]QEC32691.1 DNA transformation protein [Mannheimia haemolytica]QEC60810.1 DNA transformation protein [Mannheimia haemolytica]QED08527.1 DNA transformation protein [Mannheimia haemolytica]
MQTINEIKEEIYPIFEPIIGTIRLKTYFSYYAVFKDGLMIALYQNGATYLRIAKKDIEYIRQYPETCILCDEKIGIQSRKFHYIPQVLIDDTPKFSSLLFGIIEELRTEKYKISQKRATQIRNLPNMNLKLERMLKKIGIHSMNDFTQEGYMSTFIKLILQGFDVTEDLLFKLNGALNHQYIYTFTDQQKRELMQEANQALYNSGLRKRFNAL